MTTRTTLSVGVLLIAVAAIGALVVPKVRAQNPPPWINQDTNWTANKEKLQAFGECFVTSDAMYDALKQQARGGKPLTWPQMAEPAYDWSGIYSRTKLSPHFDPDLPMTGGPVSAKLTPAGAAVVKAKQTTSPERAASTTRSRLSSAGRAALVHRTFLHE
jgi:hypothetical protein